jgi:hypothetical protein
MLNHWVSQMMEFQRSFRPGGDGQRCSRCQYWEPHLALKEMERGECHRHAPSPLQAVISKIGKAIGAAAWACEETANIEHGDDKGLGTDYTFECQDQYEVDEWPYTSEDDWCGEFIGLSPEKLALRDARRKELRELYELERAEREAAAAK